MHQDRDLVYAIDRDRAGRAGPSSGLDGMPYAERIRIVRLAHIGRWLRAGWADFTAAPAQSALCGALFVLAGIIMTVGLWALDMLYLLTPLIAGFLIVGPALAVGIYDISRRLEAGEHPSFFAGLFAFRRNTFHLLTAGLVLMLFLMIWVRLAALLLALFFPYTSLSLSGLFGALASPEGLSMLATGTVIGGIMAAVAFVFGAVSLPLMLHHRVDVFTGALVSALAVFANLRVMVVWAAVIVTLTGLALAAGYVGLIVIMPLMGHATWHAYRDLVDWERRL